MWNDWPRTAPKLPHNCVPRRYVNPASIVQSHVPIVQFPHVMQWIVIHSSVRQRHSYIRPHGWQYHHATLVSNCPRWLLHYYYYYCYCYNTLPAIPVVVVMYRYHHEYVSLHCPLHLDPPVLDHPTNWVISIIDRPFQFVIHSIVPLSLPPLPQHDYYPSFWLLILVSFVDTVLVESYRQWSSHPHPTPTYVGLKILSVDVTMHQSDPNMSDVHSMPCLVVVSTSYVVSQYSQSFVSHSMPPYWLDYDLSYDYKQCHNDSWWFWYLMISPWQTIVRWTLTSHQAFR